MLGWILLGAFLATAGLTIAVSYLNESIAQNKMRENQIKKGTIKDIVKSDGVTHIKLDALMDDGTEQKVQFEVDGGYDTQQIKRGITLYT